MTGMGTKRRQDATFRRVVIGLLFAFAVLAAGCGNGDDEADDTTTSETATTTDSTSPTETTEDTTPTETSDSTATSDTSTSTTITSATSTATTAVSTNELASGSGCTPPSSDTLPDGRWYGFVDGAEVDQLSFDLACWFTGEAAALAAAEDGEESPPPNDFHIRNVNTQLRTLPVDPGAMVEWLPNPGDPASVETVVYSAWLDEQPGRDPIPGVWLEIENGQITGIEEQYVP